MHGGIISGLCSMNSEPSSIANWRSPVLLIHGDDDRHRRECSLRFETPDNTSNEQRGVLGGALFEETHVLGCLSARAITEAA
jgi:hypothetical protein